MGSAADAALAMPNDTNSNDTTAMSILFMEITIVGGEIADGESLGPTASNPS
jgi:hypothetical protein